MSHIKIELRKEDVDFIKGVCATFNNDPQELINVLHSVRNILDIFRQKYRKLFPKVSTCL